MKHKHYEVIIAYANGAKIQRGDGHGNWEDADLPSFYECHHYRVKPERITVGSLSFPKPENRKPAYGTRYWVPSILGEYAIEFTWMDDPVDNRHIERGMVHLSEESAAAHEDVLIRISAGKLGS